MPEDRLPARRFVTNALAWRATGAPHLLDALVRAPRSGVPHDVAAAYATLAARNGSMLDAIEHERLALPSDDRTAALAFAAGVRRLERLPAESGDEAARALVEELWPAPASTAHPHALETSTEPFELANAREPEHATGVRARIRHFSASSLNAFAECERKWFYRYACSAIDDPGSSASTYGTAFHLALEDFHAEFARPHVDDEAAMREHVADDVRWAFERNRDGFATRVEFELQLRRAQRTAGRYVDWLVAQARRAPFSVIGRETPVNLELDGHALIGFIDRLDRDEATATVSVVDYKTGSIANSAAEYRDKVRTFRDFQLPFYYWARTAVGDRVANLALIPLKDATLDVRPIVLEVTLGNGAEARGDAARGTISVATLERAKARMIEICDRLAAGTMTSFPPTDDPSACTYCAYSVACAHRPSARENAFAR